MRTLASAVRERPSTPEHLVIVEIVDGIAYQALVHLPKHPRRFAIHEFPPVTWPPACGLFQSGGVYAHAGMLEHATICSDCEVGA